MLVITHYQRLLDYIKPDRVHVLAAGRIVADSGGPELALELEKRRLRQVRWRRRRDLPRPHRPERSRRPSPPGAWRNGSTPTCANVLRETPPASPAVKLAVEPGGPFAALGGDELAFVNGRCESASRWGSRGGRGQTTWRACASSPDADRLPATRRRCYGSRSRTGASLFLLESYEGPGGGLHLQLSASSWIIPGRQGAELIAHHPHRRAGRNRHFAGPRRTCGLAPQGADYRPDHPDLRRETAAPGDPRLSHPGEGADVTHRRPLPVLGDASATPT